MENMENNENSFIYYDKITGKVLSPEEVEAIWEKVRGTHAPTNIAAAPANNLVIENGYVKSKMDQAVVDLVNKSNTEQARLADTTTTLDNLLSQKTPEEKQKADFVNDVLAEAHFYPHPKDAEDAETIVNEFKDNSEAKFVDITDQVLRTNPFADTNPPLKASTISDISDPDYALKVLRTAQAKKIATDYEKVVASSVAVNDNHPVYERKGNRIKIKYDALVKGIVAVAAVAIVYGVGSFLGKQVTALADTIDYNSAVTYIDKASNDDIHFIGNNKHIIPGSYDSYGDSIYYLDNSAIARDILGMPDEGYLSYLYLAYNQMGRDRENGIYRNWDEVIDYIGSLVDESHSNAYTTTSGCRNFEQFLTKAGYVDPETNEPSVEMFEKAGKEAVIAYANYLQEENPNIGGR